MTSQFPETNELLSEMCGIFTYKGLQHFTSDMGQSKNTNKKITLSARKPKKQKKRYSRIRHIFEKKMDHSFSQSEKSEHPGLSSLLELSHCFPQSHPTDFEIKMRFFIQHKLPFLLLDIQPKEIYKLLTILSSIIVSNKIPQKCFHLLQKEKEILTNLVLKKLRKTINPEYKNISLF